MIFKTDSNRFRACQLPSKPARLYSYKAERIRTLLAVKLIGAATDEDLAIRMAPVLVAATYCAIQDRDLDS